MANRDLFAAALAEEGVTGKLAEVARSIYQQESSSGRNTNTSNAGAVGGMQIIPSTFRSVADKGWSIDDPMHNARAGIRYLKELSKQAGDDPTLVAAGYYGGPGGMAKARKGIAVSDPRNPNAPNTLQYAQQVVSRIPQDVATVDIPEPAQVVASTGSEVPVAAPVQMAQAEVAPQAIPVMPDWSQFQQRTAPQVQPEDLNFGQVMPQVVMPKFDPSAYAVNQVVPNFAAFKRWNGKFA